MNTQLCQTCPLMSRCVTGNFTAKNVECTQCGKRGVQLRRKSTGGKDCDETIYRFAPCLPRNPEEEREEVLCRACQMLQRQRMFA